MNFQPVAAENAGTVDTIKSGAISTVQWLGHQLTVVKDVILSSIAKIIEFAKPLFANLAQYFGEIFESAKEWISANREVAGPVAVGGAVTAFAAVAGYKLIFGASQEDAPKNTNKVFA